MTVGVAQSRINEMNSIVNGLSESIVKIKQLDEEQLKTLEKDYGITLDLLFNARQFLSITAQNFQEDLNNCDVNCQCW